MPKAIPKGYHSVTPSFTFKDSQKALNFYKKAFGAKVLGTFPNLMGGKGLMHAVMQIGDSMIMMGDEMPGMKCESAETMGGSPVSFFIYVPNVDAAFKKALAAGAKVEMSVTDQFWGDRAGSVKDPFGHSWMIATHKHDYTKAQVKKNAMDFFAKMKNGSHAGCEA